MRLITIVTGLVALIAGVVADDICDAGITLEGFSCGAKDLYCCGNPSINNGQYGSFVTPRGGCEDKGTGCGDGGLVLNTFNTREAAPVHDGSLSVEITFNIGPFLIEMGWYFLNEHIHPRH
ncbi:hypothetical protein BUE80_DR002828 [Diplocarpon rosae]|nr:hypothetical protein BUE80_DR002828 [Diplocarpon rosae]